uniref:Uncharacterized protein n=1 Tax=Lates calcarifer TaxID=8187 RepID=A0A4W6G2Y7_LATCA
WYFLLQGCCKRLYRNLQISSSSRGRDKATAAHSRVVDLAGVALKNLKVKCIRHEEPDSVIKDSIAGGGVNPYIHKSVTRRRRQQNTV